MILLNLVIKVSYENAKVMDKLEMKKVELQKEKNRLVHELGTVNNKIKRIEHRLSLMIKNL